MKLFCSILLLLIITVEYIQSKETLHRTYIVQRDNVIQKNQLSAYTVYDSSGKNILYRLKPTSTDIDTIVVTDYPAKNMVANLEGEWVENTFNVTLSIYDKKLGKWIDGNIRKDPHSAFDKYFIFWNMKHLNTNGKLFSSRVQIRNTHQKELLAEFRRRYWHSFRNRQFQLKTYSSEYPDIIYFFILAINDHRIQIAESK
jgi:hypothetical protein